MNATRKTLSGLLFSAIGMLSANVLADTTDAEKNLHKLNVPEGFNVEIYAEVPNARQMALGQSTGTVFVGTRNKQVYAVVDKDKDRKADQVVTILDDLKVGNGVAMFEGNLYVAEQNRIARYAAPGFDLSLPFADMREVIFEDLPDKGHHGWRYIAFGPDGKLYVTVGAPCNICDVNGYEATIIRMNPDGSDAEIYAEGVRNSVGMDFQPETGALFFTDNNTDMMGDDNPPGELNAASQIGQHFGFPYYAGGDARHKDWADKAVPTDVTFPVAEFQAHTANLGFKFYTGKQFPDTYQGDAIIAQHGSWNRTEPVGYALVRVTFDDNHNVTGQETFIDGWLNDGEAWGRPTDVLQLPDGSLLVSDDYNGVIYRISYGENMEKAVVKTSTSQSKPLTDLVMPESAIAAPNGNIYITEIGEFGKAGDGKVTRLNADGSTQTLADNLNDPKGIDLFNHHLYVADVDQLVKISLDGKTEILARAADFPGKPVFLNDVEIDGKGNIFVSDSGDDDGKHAGIYRVTPEGKVTEVISDKSGIKRPNGLLNNGVNQLLVADFGTGDLFTLNLSSGAIKKVNQGFGGADGLVRDSNGQLYVSDWANGKVWQLSEPKATPLLMRDDFVSAADIALSADGKHLLVPDMKAGEMTFLPLH
ncbi:L-sorbosone dehydrogenase [Methylophaga frappieri]|uniref:L-sorbosone dehydrogenase n=1 Tax=Methylophaga frappieri (strain ATCC BAA-2434 / DSM 25690 / JAM7) TaxID=754477 RepID=I1YH21_METFJ|nr:PQQ-dependent sugar dehydrogenase [Methylophaga frappieri]AFJ02214.1 L-sorbosone dehydrogenase [Methylophaga frappieri]